MDLLFSMVPLALGTVFLIVFVRDRKAKQFAQGQPAVSAVVRKVEKSTYQSDGSTRWEIQLIFEAIGFGPLRNVHTFDSQEERKNGHSPAPSAQSTESSPIRWISRRPSLKAKKISPACYG